MKTNQFSLLACLMSIMFCGMSSAATLSLTALTNMGADIDYIAAYNGVNYLKLMTNADLIVEGTSLESPGWGMPLSFRGPKDEEYDQIANIHVARIIASIWSKEETLARMNVRDGKHMLYVLIRPSYTEVLNDPILIGQERYLLWLRQVCISDTNVLSALVRNCWPTNAFYEAVIRRKGAIQLTWNNTNHYARMEEMFTKMDNEMRERCEAWNRRCEREYFTIGFGTTNRAAIVEATKLFARAMTRGKSRTAAQDYATAALSALGAEAKTNLACMADIPQFESVDFAP